MSTTIPDITKNNEMIFLFVVFVILVPHNTSIALH
jgi:hypothetical protein